MRIQENGATRKKILLAARRVFAERGREGARMHQIAIAAKVNQALLHYYFNNKENLYRAVLRDLFRKLIEGLKPIVEESLSAPEKIRRFVSYYIDFLAAHPEMPPLIMREMAGGAKEMVPVIKKLGEELNFFLPLQLLQMIRGGVARGELRPAPPEQSLLSLMGLCLFYFVARPLIGAVFGLADEETFLAQRKAAILDLLQGGLLRGAKP